MKIIIPEMKNFFEKINSRLDEGEVQISKLQNKITVSVKRENEKEKRLKRNEENLRDLWNNMQCNNICIIGAPERDECEQGIENHLFEELMAETFPNLVKEKIIEVQEAQRFPIKMNTKRPIARQIIIKMAKSQDKERILKPPRVRQSVTDQGIPIKISADFSTKTLQARKVCQEMFSDES